MSNFQKMTVMALAIVAVAGCANPNRAGNAYTRDQARQEMTVRMGIVESVREVVVESAQSGVGTASGAAIGGIAGGNLGGGKGQIVGAILGAVAGGVAGTALEHGATRKPATEITVKLDNGHLLAIVQEGDERFVPGQRDRKSVV